MGGSMNVSIYNWAGKNTSPFPSASSPSYEGFVGGNTFRNNIMGTYGLTSTKQHVRYYQNYINPGDTTDCDATCQAWAAGDKWVNNIFYKTGGTTSGTTLVRLGNGNGTFSDYNCSTLAGAVNTNANCLFSNPQFVNDTITNWSNPQLYDFRLQSSSPAKNAGTQAPNSPVFDIVGNRFSVGAPSIGAYEFIAASILNRHGGTRISGGTVR